MCYFATRFIPVPGLTPIKDLRNAARDEAGVPQRTT
jgi:hypothetical protein